MVKFIALPEVERWIYQSSPFTGPGGFFTAVRLVKGPEIGKRFGHTSGVLHLQLMGSSRALPCGY